MLPLIEEGAPPLGVTGVVAAELPEGARSPRPANKCTHNIPLTPAVEDAKPPVEVNEPVALPVNPDNPVVDGELPTGFSSLYFKNSDEK